jgi:curved DNA-binding protein
MPEDLYSALGVRKDADADAIKKAYRKLAAQLHPDKNPGNQRVEARFKRVNHAYEVLHDAKKRKLYDEFGEDGLREGFDAEKVRAYRDWSSRRARSSGVEGGVSGGQTVDIEDLFRGASSGGGVGDLFGDLLGRARRGRAAPAKGSDLESEVTIDFATAVRGGEVELELQGATDSALKVRIPPGASEGSRVRIPGHGSPSTGGGVSGDLVLTIHVTPHEQFRRDGDDLHLYLPLRIGEAFYGAKVRVPTPDGVVSLKVPEHTQSGNVLRLRGKGVTKKGHPPGDLFVHFLVQLPVEGGSELAQHIDELARYQTSDPRRGIHF